MIEKIYRDFIASIDTSVAGRDEHGDLRWHVECTAETNAADTIAETNATLAHTDAYWTVALDTARMCADDWRSFYPQLKI